MERKKPVPTVMDVLITKITPKTVKYDLWLGRQGKCWRVPSASKFDKSQIEAGKRYRVWSEPIWSFDFDYNAQQFTWDWRFDWTRVEEVPPLVKSTVKSRKEREFAQLRATMQDADDGSLFKW